MSKDFMKNSKPTLYEKIRFFKMIVSNNCADAETYLEGCVIDLSEGASDAFLCKYEGVMIRVSYTRAKEEIFNLIETSVSDDL